MTVSLERYSRLIGAIYDAALDASRWDAVAVEIALVFGAISGALLVCGDGTPRILSGGHIGKELHMDSPHVRSYRDYYGRIDPIAAALETAADGAILLHHEVIAPALARKNEFYNDFALPIDSGDGMAARLRVDDGNVAWLNVAASLRTSPFATEERIALLQSLLPHLQRSLRVQELLDGLVVERERAHAALDRLEHGVALVARSGAVLFANTAAMTLCQRADGINIARGSTLHAGRNDEEELLRRLTAQATGAAAALPQAGSMLVDRPSGMRPFAIHVMPLAPGDAQPPWQAAVAMIVIVDNERKPVAMTESLCRLYRLTRAEARIAACVLRGEGLQLIAEQLKVTLSTVRIHLQRVFEKTGTHRQADLVRLLLRLQAGLDQTTTRH